MIDDEMTPASCTPAASSGLGTPHGVKARRGGREAGASILRDWRGCQFFVAHRREESLHQPPSVDLAQSLWFIQVPMPSLRMRRPTNSCRRVGATRERPKAIQQRHPARHDPAVSASGGSLSSAGYSVNRCRAFTA